MSAFTSIGKYTLISLAAFLIGVSVSGQNARDYKVLSDADTVKIGTATLSVRSIVERYRPQIYENAEYKTSKFLFMWYEAIPMDNSLILTYRPTWDDERNIQSPIKDNLYRLYRRLYYGNPPIDTEYIQIVIDLLTGEETLVRFETPEANYEYFEFLQPHYTVEIARSSNEKEVTKKIFDPKGIVTLQKSLKVESISILQLAVTTWNHLFVYLQEENTDQFSSYREVDAELKYLTEEEYRAHRFARRSQGSFSRRVGIVEALPTIIITLLILVSIDIFFFQFLLRKVDKF